MREIFETSIMLDTAGHDEWDPLVRMMVHVIQAWPEYRRTLTWYASWHRSTGILLTACCFLARFET